MAGAPAKIGATTSATQTKKITAKSAYYLDYSDDHDDVERNYAFSTHV
jgi:hypothetical protein